MLISSGKSSIVSDTDNINYQGQLFHTNNNLEACCIIFLMCFLSISKPSQALQSTAIWGQCWPPRSQSRQMGCIHRSGGRGNADKKKKQQNWSNSERKEGHESLTEGEKHRVGKSRKDTVDYRTDLPICAVGTVGSSHSFSHCLDAQSHTLRHTHLLRRDTWLLWPI